MKARSPAMETPAQNIPFLFLSLKLCNWILKKNGRIAIPVTTHDKKEYIVGRFKFVKRYFVDIILVAAINVRIANANVEFMLQTQNVFLRVFIRTQKCCCSQI